ncbi:pyroglutamyl-peptidase I [Oenococcus sp.]|uniref:pyroglutamyl-peptidase I n=1 Tax=Oenococcus sp. TaxID=1979414 RepID=UPI0039E9DC14
MKILVTGFNPFGPDKVNPSWQTAAALPNKISGSQIIKKMLPTVFAEAKDQLEADIHEIQPDLVLCLGLAGGRSEITLEKVAINYVDARIPDNSGAQPIGSLDPLGPDAYFENYEVKELVDRLQQQHLPVAMSLSAGAYVCNATSYFLLNILHHQYPKAVGAFIHVPYTPEMGYVDQPSLPLAVDVQTITAYLTEMIQDLKEEKHD